MQLTVVLSLIIWVTSINCKFVVQPPSIMYGCAGKEVTLPWTLDAYDNVEIVRWFYNSLTIIMRQIGPKASPIPEGAYVGRVENGSNSDLIILSPTLPDSGIYQCGVTYNNGEQMISEMVSLYIYDVWEVSPMVTEERVGKSNIEDPSVQQIWSTGAEGTSIKVTEDGVYSLCIKGGKAECLHPSSNNCISYSVRGLDRD